MCDLIAVVTGAATDELDPVWLGGHLVDLWAEGVARGTAARERLGEERFVDVHVGDLVRDPVATVATAYEGIGWPFTAAAESAMAAWWAANPPGRHGTHEPDPARYGLEPGAVREQFAGYLARFGAPDA